MNLQERNSERRANYREGRERGERITSGRRRGRESRERREGKKATAWVVAWLIARWSATLWRHAG